MLLNLYFAYENVSPSLNSFIQYMNPVQKTQCTSRTVVTWVPSLALCMINMTSLALPFILSKFSHRMVIIFGAVLAASGAFGMAFATHLPLLFVAVFISYVGASLVHVPGTVRCTGLMTSIPLFD